MDAWAKVATPLSIAGIKSGAVWEVFGHVTACYGWRSWGKIRSALRGRCGLCGASTEAVKTFTLSVLNAMGAVMCVVSLSSYDAPFYA